jgi:hypothetical protein
VVGILVKASTQPKKRGARLSADVVQLLVAVVCSTRLFSSVFFHPKFFHVSMCFPSRAASSVFHPRPPAAHCLRAEHKDILHHLVVHPAKNSTRHCVHPIQHMRPLCAWPGVFSAHACAFLLISRAHMIRANGSHGPCSMLFPTLMRLTPQQTR